MPMAKSYAELQAMTVDDLIQAHDEVAKSTLVGQKHYLDEIMRRQATKQANRMEVLTETMARLTWVIVALTVVNTLLVVVALFIA